ncbi:hypothetical protein [Polynucleobacter sp. JS-JIR-5-A7]|uniref:hypothetical protein n=1 Tax=Polynucleobacter sp. JS-JIR-5-A7 TaxID=1758395 RepID=UPI001BFD9D21|nr:hypothetical protein [Polynucleobacter sp. JS-JIR-5-A7]QWE07118.1 hypothetical protein AOC29_02670 [Polynucleobacter sp. JS-JIR-5-A7]
MNAKSISQKSNYAGDFGEVLRSSGFFYCKQTKVFKTTISFLNYWHVRQDIEICAIANIRNLDGELIRRERLSFEGGFVINYSPNFTEDFEGSIEIEIFSLKNLRIPYAALMAIYEAPKSISMVHGYARAYSQHEIEEKRTITNGNEACIPLIRDGITELIFHNGDSASPKQSATLNIRLDSGEEINANIDIESLKPFQTKKVALSKFFEHHKYKWEIAEAKFSFNLSNAFTRVLCVTKSASDEEFQVTHSDFNYQIHKTDSIKDSWGIVPIPKSLIKSPIYKLITWGANEQFDANILPPNKTSSLFSGIELNVTDVEPGSIVKYVSHSNKPFPSRIHNAIYIRPPGNYLPAICNLGVFHKERPPKKMWWAVVGSGKNISTNISVSALTDIYGLPGDITVNIRLYSEYSRDYLSMEIELSKLLEKISTPLQEIFPESNAFLHDSFGYITFFSEYGGTVLFTEMIHSNESVTIEHGF